MVTKKDKERGFKDKPLLDIVAGTSIGAINSAVLVSYVVENNTWEGSAERLNEFWDYLSKESSFDYIPAFGQWWDYLHHNINRDIAAAEAARRYYAAKEFSFIGVPTVFSPLTPQVDTKFFDPQNLMVSV
jgi:NTE family protein